MTLSPEDAQAFQPLPQSDDAEAAVLGAMMLDPACIPLVAEVLPRGSDRAFILPVNAQLFRVLTDMHANDQPVDIVTLEDDLRSRGLLEKVGGRDSLLDLVESVPSSANAAYYARIVRDKAALRDLLVLGRRLNEDALAPEADPVALIAALERRLRVISGRSAAVAEPQRLGDVIRSVADELLAGTAVRGLDTGFGSLDAKLGGMRAGQLLCVAARPSVGKTAFALQVARHVADQGVPVGLFSLEMSDHEIAKRSISQQTSIPGDRLVAGRKLDMFDERTIEQFESRGTIWLDDSTDLTPDQFRARSRRLREQHQVGLIVVDYLGLMRDPDSKGRGRNEAVSNISRAIKTTARELEIPILALHQLNRASERENRAPVLSDLRDSGSVEQDCDVVMFLHLSEKFDPHKSRPDQYPIWVLIRKHRAGPLSALRFTFTASTTTFMPACATTEETMYDTENSAV